MPVAKRARPDSALFAEVVGQDAAVAALRAAAARPVHAYLLQGPQGSGRRAAARGFAAALLCPNGGCASCRHCRLALAGTHPDLVTVERSGASMGVDEARYIVVASQRRPFEAARQVIVVADVHLAARAAPALLKTIEEPAAGTHFVLVADTIPPELLTVASRCVEIPFGPVPRQDVNRWLVERGSDPDRALQIAEVCGGDLRRARLLAEDEGFARRVELWKSLPQRLDGSGAAAAALAGEVLEAAASALAPLRTVHEAELHHLSEQAEAIGERGVAARREVLDRHRREERQWRTTELQAGLAVLARVYRDRLVDVLRPGTGPHPSAATNADATPHERAVSLVSESSRNLKRNPNELLLLESLFLRLSRP